MCAVFVFLQKVKVASTKNRKKNSFKTEEAVRLNWSRRDGFWGLKRYFVWYFLSGHLLPVFGQRHVGTAPQQIFDRLTGSVSARLARRVCRLTRINCVYFFAPCQCQTGPARGVVNTRDLASFLALDSLLVGVLICTYPIQVAIRNIRREAVDAVKKAEKAKNLGKDQVRREDKQVEPSLLYYNRLILAAGCECRCVLFEIFSTTFCVK